MSVAARPLAETTQKAITVLSKELGIAHCVSQALARYHDRHGHQPDGVATWKLPNAFVVPGLESGNSFASYGLASLFHSAEPAPARPLLCSVECHVFHFPDLKCALRCSQ